MRLSYDRSSLYYSPRCTLCVVLVDGQDVTQRGIVEAYEEEGWVRQYAADQSLATYRPVTETVYGTVQILFPEHPDYHHFRPVFSPPVLPVAEARPLTETVVGRVRILFPEYHCSWSLPTPPVVPVAEARPFDPQHFTSVQQLLEALKFTYDEKTREFVHGEPPDERRFSADSAMGHSAASFYEKMRNHGWLPEVYSHTPPGSISTGTPIVPFSLPVYLPLSEEHVTLLSLHAKLLHIHISLRCLLQESDDLPLSALGTVHEALRDVTDLMQEVERQITCLIRSAR